MMCNIPDDIKEDWLRGILKLIRIMKENPKYIRDPDGWLPRVKDRCKEIIKKRNIQLPEDETI